MKVKFTEGYAEGFKMSVPECFKASLNNGIFSQGDTIYSDTVAYEKPWGEALKQLEYAVEVQGMDGDLIRFDVLHPNDEKLKLEILKTLKLSSSDFIERLRDGIDLTQLATS